MINLLQELSLGLLALLATAHPFIKQNFSERGRKTNSTAGTDRWNFRIRVLDKFMPATISIFAFIYILTSILEFLVCDSRI